MPSKPRLSREEQRARTRAELLEAAAIVFARNGYHATSVDMVAEAAGYTKGAVYSNFDSKEELFLGVIDEGLSQAVSTLEEIVATVAPEERADLIGERRTKMQVFDRDWHLLETEFALYAARNEHIRERLAERQLSIRTRIADLLTRHLADIGATQEIDVLDLARILIATGDGLTLMALVEPEETEGGTLMAMTLRAFERSLTS